MFKFAHSLLLVGVLLGLATGYAASANAQQPAVEYDAVLTVKRMCCAKESVPAIKELLKIPGVKRVSVDYKMRTLMIEATDTVPSPRGIWEVAERIKIEPTRLTTPQQVYTSKPRL